MDNTGLIPHLFRTEYRKIVAVLCTYFGFAQIETAEDIASDTFLTATQAWGISGPPENPAAWLYQTAKNKAKNIIQRDAIFRKKVMPEVSTESGVTQNADIDLSPQNISDSQLRMMFAVCHPSLSPEAQVALSLRVLCGFGIEEIADAFLTNKATINKRLLRAKEKLREEKIALEIPAALNGRLPSVLATIYLLFNAGYYSAHENDTLRKELCFEAIRLNTMLIENESTNLPVANALLALMCFHLSRFDARTGKAEIPVLYEEQDASLWSDEWIGKGAYFLQQASRGADLSAYHLEAGIAYWHTQKEDSIEKWSRILPLYDKLLQLTDAPVVVLSRIYAFSKVNGKEKAIAEAERSVYPDNHVYFTLLGELYTGTDNKKAKACFAQALSLAKHESEKKVVERKMNLLK